MIKTGSNLQGVQKRYLIKIIEYFQRHSKVIFSVKHIKMFGNFIIVSSVALANDLSDNTGNW